MKLRISVILVMLLFACGNLFAAPAAPDIIDIDQPDGAKFKARINGDEFQSWIEATESGHTVIKNDASNQWEYAEKTADGKLKGSGIKVASDGSNAPSFIPKGVRPDRDEEKARQHDQLLKKFYQERTPALSSSSSPDGTTPAGVSDPSGATGDWTPVPVSGSKKLLVVLVNFANRSLVTTAVTWNSTIFDTTPGVKSVANFYNDNSFGALTIAPAAHTQPGNPPGIVTVTIAANHPDSGSNYNYTGELSILTKALAQAANYVDFAAFDTNGDGVLAPAELSIYLIYAGYEASGASNLHPNIWAHSWSGSVAAGTKTVTNWALNGELNSSSLQHPIGVVTHELGHALCGLPDLYDTSGFNAGLGHFSLMAGGSWGKDTGESSGVTPVSLDAWSREYLGWTSPVAPSNGAISLDASLASANNALKLMKPAASTYEYWLAENRDATRGWDRGLRGLLGSPGYSGGLLIAHIDVTSGTQGSNDINRYVAGKHQGVVAEMANSACNLVTTTCRGSVNTLYYGGNNASFGNATAPNSKYYSGIPTNIELLNISPPGSTMTAAYSVGGSGPSGFIKINSGALLAKSPSVTLNLSASVALPLTVKEMSFSNDGTNWSAWEPYKTGKSWVLASGGDGARTVTVSYRDSGGNASIDYSATITLDTTPPKAFIVVNRALLAPTRSSVINFGVSRLDVVSYKYKIDAGLWSAEIPATTSVNFSGIAAGSHQLSVIGKDAAGNWQSTSSPSTFTWNVEMTAPTTVATPSGGNYSTPQSIALSSEAGATIYFTTNGTTPTTASPKFTAPISASSTITLKYFAVDGAGNAEAVKTQVYNFPPTATVSGVAAKTRLTGATLTVGGARVVKYSWSLDGVSRGAAIPVATKIIVSGLAAGIHTVSVTGYNSLDQAQTTATDLQWTVDLTRPTTTATPPAGTYPDAQAVALAADEAATIYYTTNGTIPTTASAKYSAPLVIKAATTLKFFSVDSAGNVEVVKSALYSLPPKAVVSGVAAITKASAATLTVSGLGVTKYDWSLDGVSKGTGVSVATKISVAGLAEGSHTVSVTGYNNSAQTQGATDVTWTVDQTRPLTAATPAGGTYSGIQTVSLGSSEAATVYYTTNGYTPTTASAKYTAPLVLKTNTTLKFFAVDKAGNVEPVKTEVYLLPATVTGVSAVSKLTTATLTVSGARVAKYDWKLDGIGRGNNIPVATKIVLSGLSEGTHTVSVKSYDSGGNQLSDFKDTTWVVDLTKPVTVPDVSGGTYGSPQTVTLSSSETAKIYYTKNGTTPTALSAIYTAPISVPTTTTLKYFAVDSAGNIESIKTQKYVLPPTAQISGIPDVVAADTPVAFSVGGSHVTAYKYRVDNSEWSAETAVAYLRTLAGIPSGIHTLEVIGKNAGGSWQDAASPTAKVWTVN